MAVNAKTAGRISRVRPARYALIVLWCLLLLGFFLWDILKTRQETASVASNVARAYFSKDLAFRLWGSSHGGVYVSIDEKTPPNPHLEHVPERDIQTPSGKRLTLMNPAYMVRQLQEEFAKLYGVKGHITSLKHFRPETAPDDWEKAALKEFEAGRKEVQEFTVIGDEPYLRLMRPLIADKACLKCHAFQGYKEGDVRGGVSVSLPMKDFLAIERSELTTQIISLGSIFILGFVGIMVGMGRLERREQERDAAMEALVKAGRELETRVKERTSELGKANEQLRVEIDERRQLETLLRQERDTARKYLDVAGTIIVALDRDGNVTLINRKGIEVLGCQPETLVGRNWFDTFLPEWDRDRMKKAFSQVIAGEIDSLRYFENPVLTEVGEDRYIAWYNTLLTDDAGQILGTLSSGEDITDRKRAENALKESHERLDLALTGGDLGLWDWNVQTGKAVWNHRTFEMLGYATGEIESEISTWKRMIHPDDWPLVSSALNKHLEGLSSSYEAEYRIQSKTGEWKWILSKGKVLEHDSNGKPLRITGTTLDITDRKRTDEALRVSEAQKQAILDGITANIAFVNEDLEMLWVNKTAANSVGKLPSQMIGQECHKFWGDPEKPCDGCPTVTAFKTKKSEHATVVTPDGRIWDEKGEPVFDTDGRLIGVVEIAQDITDRVQAEKEKETLMSQLFQAQKMEAIGTLTGGIAHDFNNLLTVILGFSEMLLLDRNERDPAYDDLQKIVLSARSGAEMVQRLLVFSRKAETNPVPLDLNSQIRNTEQFLSRTLSKMIRIEIRLSDDLNLVHADPPQMEQIVMNLAINAKEAMPDGGLLTLATSNVTLESDFCARNPGIAPGDYVLLSISDTGRGMDQETQDRMFDPFFTAKGWDFRKGTGLGLPVVLGIVQQHGGCIECLSELGKGTTFNIYLPSFAAETQSEQECSRDVPALGTETILLVDDENLVRELGERILTKSGYRVLTARNGREGLDIYRQHQLDIALVILDLIMPEMSGKDCLRELSKIDPQVKVIVSSGHSDTEDHDDFPRETVRGTVKKPYGMGHLLQTVRKALDEN